MTENTLAVGGLAMIVLLVVTLWVNGLDWSVILGVAGSVASVIGLPMVLLQIRKVRRESEATASAIRETHRRLEHTVSAGDVARTVKMIEQLQWYVTEKQYELAKLRLQDVRGLLVQLGASRPFADAGHSEEVQRLTLSVGVDLHALFTTASKRHPYDSSSLFSTLEQISALLMKVEHQLRYPSE